MAAERLDAIVNPAMPPAAITDLLHGDHGAGGSTSAPARAGYPVITVPCGEALGLPLGLAFIGGAFSEPTLLRLAYAFEQAILARRPPSYLPTLALG